MQQAGYSGSGEVRGEGTGEGTNVATLSDLSLPRKEASCDPDNELEIDVERESVIDGEREAPLILPMVVVAAVRELWQERGN